MSRTSGRDIVYATILKSISKRPIFGYGIFNSNASEHGAHNIFLELLLQGGIIYLLFWIIVFYLFVRRLLLIIKYDNSNLILIPLSVYPFTLLLFSGSYLEQPLFWFVIAYVFNYSQKQNYKSIYIT